MIAAGLGVALVIARRVAQHRHGGVIACVLLLLPLANLAARRDETRVLLAAAQAVVRDAPGDLPIVTGTGLRFFELSEGDPTLAQRLVFLTVPGLAQSPDPTNDHQVQRWARIRPDLPVYEAEAFLAGRDAILMFSDPSSTDLLPDYLAARGYRVETLREERTARLVRLTCTVRGTC